jgi:molybdopterin-binding protein
MKKPGQLFAIFAAAASVAIASTPVDAQNGGRAVIRGRVVDAETGEAIASVKVELPGRRTSVYTDRAGRFELALAPGSYDLNLKQLGYFEQQLRIGVTRNDSLVFRLSPQAVMLEELRAYGSRLADRAARASIAARAFDAERLKVATSGSILSFLQTDGGLSVMPCGDPEREGSCARVRGMPSPVQVYVDGLPSLGGLDELRDIPAGEVFHVNLYGGGDVVEVFTRRYAAMESHNRVMHLRTPASMPRGIQWQSPIGDPNH